MKAGARVVALGTGSAVANARRDNTALLIELSGTPLLVDFPGSPSQKILRAGVDPLRVTLAVLTHRHVDHAYGLPSLLHQAWARLKWGDPSNLPPEAREHALDILGPRDAVHLVKGMLETFGFVERDGMFPVRAHAIDGDVHERELDRGWTLELVRGEHGSAVCYGVIARHPEDRITVAYSSDTEPTERFLARAAGADVLIHECYRVRDAPPGHTDAIGLAEAIARHEPPRRLVPVHLGTRPQDEGEPVRAALRERLPDVDVLLPRDGEEIFRRDGG